MVTLREVTPENYDAVISLNVAPGQEGFVAPNVHSIAESKVFSGLIPLCIYEDDLLVGFTMYGVHPETKEHWIIRLMVDAQFQGRGYGRAAMHELIRLMHQHPECRDIFVSYEPGNEVAAGLCRSLGFQETGRVEGGETVVWLPANSSELPSDLDACPRCGEPLDEIRWGRTNCPRCGLHFECC